MSSTIQTINPYTNKVLKTYNAITSSQIKSVLKTSNERFQSWKQTSIKERCRLLKTLAQILEDNKMGYAKQVTLEMGKPIQQSIAEIEKCITLCDFYTTNAEDFLSDELIETEA
ncbi:MAG TPA: aldehyde dehydrogenase family protein, partial [Aquaticitalea sp.]|nr:aldehyde dehydrogenase family protein [Aquaticitalea sp.]